MRTFIKNTCIIALLMVYLSQLEKAIDYRHYKKRNGDDFKMNNYIEIETNIQNETVFVKTNQSLCDIDEHLNDIGKEIDLVLTLENFLPHNRNLDFDEIALHLENDYTLYNDVPFSDFLDYGKLKEYKLNFSLDRFKDEGGLYS